MKSNRCGSVPAGGKGRGCMQIKDRLKQRPDRLDLQKGRAEQV